MKDKKIKKQTRQEWQTDKTTDEGTRSNDSVLFLALLENPKLYHLFNNKWPINMYIYLINTLYLF